MKARGLALQGAMAAAGLAAAFLTWQREPVGSPSDVVVVEASKRALQRVRYEDATRWVELYRDTDETLWVQLGTKPVTPPSPAPQADAGTPTADGGTLADAGTALADGGTLAPPTATPTPIPPPPPPRELRANKAAEDLFNRFAPLRANRGLGTLDDKKLAEVGLKDSLRRLTVKLASGDQSFRVAQPSTGWGSPYLRREADGTVFLLGPSLLPDLESASSRLVDRTLHAFEDSGYDSLTVTQGKASRTFLVSGQGPGPRSLAPEGSPDKPDELARNWHDRIWRLFPVDFLGRGEEPPGGTPEVIFQVQYRRSGKPVGELTVARGASGEFFLRTEHTAGWARLHSGVDTLVGEVTKVVSGG